MARTITATLRVDEDATPPVVRLTVQIDSATLASRDLTPLEAVRAIGVLAPETAAVWQPATVLVDRLRGAVAQGEADQAARVLALQGWEDAIAAFPPQLPDPPAPDDPAAVTPPPAP